MFHEFGLQTSINEHCIYKIDDLDMNDIYSINKQINEKTGADTGGATTFELVKAQVAKLGGDISKVVDIRTGEQQVLEHIKPAGPDVVIQTSKDVSISSNGTTVVSPDEGYDAIKDVVVDVNVPDPELEELSVTANGTYTPTKYGYSKVDVAVPSKPEQTKSVTINQNGTTSVLPDEGNVLSKVDVTVNVAGGGGGDLFGFDAIGYNGTEQPIKDYVAYSKQIYDNWDPNTTNVSYKFSDDTKLVYMPKVDTSKVTDMSGMLNYCSSLTTVPLFDTSNVTDMSNMLKRCSSLTTVPLFDTSNVTDMSYMFYNCKSLTEVPQFDTSKVTDMREMFNYCSSLTTVPLFDTSNVTNMSHMFDICSSLSTVPQFDTSNVTNMSAMLNSCSSLTTVPLFDTSNVTDMNYMLNSCSSLTTVPQFDTSKVTDMSYMFVSCRKLTTVPQFDTSNVTDMREMFYFCSSLTEVPQFDTSNVTDIVNMFSGCSKLTNFGGLLNIGQAFTSTFYYDLSDCLQLTDESIQNVIDGLYDMSSKGFSPTLTFRSNVYAKLTDAQKAQITAKNWTVTA